MLELQKNGSTDYGSIMISAEVLGSREDLDTSKNRVRGGTNSRDHDTPLVPRRGTGVGGSCVGEVLGVVTSPDIMSWIARSSASTRLDICAIRSSICDDISSNLVSSCSKSVSTKAVSSCGLEISPGLAVTDCFVGVLEPDATSEVG